MKDMKKYVAEFIGTFVLVFFACGVAGQTGGALGVTSAAFGLVIVAMAYSIGNISGCHINPAVSLAMLISKRMSTRDFVGYLVAQFLGGIVGALLLWAILGNNEALGQNGLYEGKILVSLIVEILLTFVFVLTILGVTSKAENSSVAGLVIGLALVLVHIFGIHFTGTSVNPARSLGPALFAGGEALSCVWVFFVGPLVGGALAAVVYKFLDPEAK